jgi:uncharacterized membrane protein
LRARPPRDPKTALDSRELYPPESYFAFVFVYATVGFLFLWNQFTRLAFSISTHSVMTFTGILKTISCYFFAQLWTEKGITDDFPLKNRLLWEFFSVIAIALLSESSLFVTTWFFFTRSLSSCTSHIGFLIGLVLMNAIFIYTSRQPQASTVCSSAFKLFSGLSVITAT